MPRRARIAAVPLTVLAALLAVAPPGRAVRTPGPAAAAQRQAPPVDLIARLVPLRELAAALDATGRTRFAATYSGVEIDAATDTVRLDVTDLAAGRSLLRAARRKSPTAAWQRVRLHRAAFAHAALERATARLIRTAGPDLVAVHVPAQGDGLVAEYAGTAAGFAAGPRSAPVADVGVPVRAVAGTPRTAKSWAEQKWRDTQPYIGGDVLTATGRSICTAGLPAVRRSDHKPVLITAAHCFALKQRVYTGGGRAGAIGNGVVGYYVGTVTGRITEWDADEVTGTNNNADESDTTTWRPLTGVADSYVGDYVCHDGAASFYLGHPTPCGIKVTDADLWFKIGGYWARGVEGIDVRTGWGAHNGDSGGTVFALEPHGVRQVRGIVSSGGADGTPDQRRVDWTEAVDIFRALGLELNPQT